MKAWHSYFHELLKNEINLLNIPSSFLVQPVFFHLSQQLDIAIPMSESVHIIIIYIRIVRVYVGMSVGPCEYSSEEKWEINYM